MTAIVMMMLTFEPVPPEGTWTLNGGPTIHQIFQTAAAPWTNPPWLPIPYIMAAEEYIPSALPPQRMMTGMGL